MPDLINERISAIRNRVANAWIAFNRKTINLEGVSVVVETRKYNYIETHFNRKEFQALEQAIVAFAEQRITENDIKTAIKDLREKSLQACFDGAMYVAEPSQNDYDKMKLLFELPDGLRVMTVHETEQTVTEAFLQKCFDVFSLHLEQYQYKLPSNHTVIRGDTLLTVQKQFVATCVLALKRNIKPTQEQQELYKRTKDEDFYDSNKSFVLKKELDDFNISDFTLTKDIVVGVEKEFGQSAVAETIERVAEINNVGSEINKTVLAQTTVADDDDFDFGEPDAETPQQTPPPSIIDEMFLQHGIQIIDVTQQMIHNAPQVTLSVDAENKIVAEIAAEHSHYCEDCEDFFTCIDAICIDTQIKQCADCAPATEMLQTEIIAENKCGNANCIDGAISLEGQAHLPCDVCNSAIDVKNSEASEELQPQANLVVSVDADKDKTVAVETISDSQFELSVKKATELKQYVGERVAIADSADAELDDEEKQLEGVVDDDDGLEEAEQDEPLQGDLFGDISVPKVKRKKMFSDDTIIETAFDYHRREGFPYREVSPAMAMFELQQLAETEGKALIQSKLCYQVADTYHRHRFHANANGMSSPFASFNDDKKLRKAIKLELKLSKKPRVYAGGMMTLVNGTQACSNFRPGFAAHLYREYAPENSTVLDTSTGYGGRLLGAVASQQVSRYIGIDPNIPTFQANIRMIEALKLRSLIDFELYNLPAEDVDVEIVRNRCDFSFTSPPYFAKEIYSNDDTQSWMRYKTGEDWRDKFLRKMLELTYIALKPGCFAIVNIADVKLKNKVYPLASWTVQMGEAVGFKHIDTANFPMMARFGKGMADEVAVEPVIVFKKPE